MTPDFKFFITHDLGKGLKLLFAVIPAKAGIQYYQDLTNTLVSGFHRSYDFL